MSHFFQKFVVLILFAIAVQPVLADDNNQTASRDELLAEAARLDSQFLELYKARRFEEAEPLAHRSVAIVEKVLGPEHPNTAMGLINLGRLYWTQGRYADAEPLLQRALKINEKALGREHPNTAICLYNLARICESLGRYAEAEPLLQRALKINEKALGREHPATATSLNSLAMLYRSQGRYDDAEPLLQRALNIREKVLGPEHLATATSLDSLAQLYHSQGRHAEAEPLFQRALKIWEKVLGPKHSHTAVCLNNLALLYQSQGRFAEAEPLFQRALKIWEKVLGPKHSHTAICLNNLALLYQSQGRFAEAELLFQRALKIKEKALGSNHFSTATSLNSLAMLYRSQGRYDDAEPLLQRALNIREKVLGREHPATATSLNSLALLYEYQGRYAEAEPLFKRALNIREKALGPEHPETASTLNNLAVLYHSQGRYAEAEPLFKRALKIREKALGPEHPDTARSLNNLAGLYRWQGRSAETEPLLERALKIREKVLGLAHPDTAVSLNSLAMLYRWQGRYGEAEPLYKRALKTNEKTLGTEHQSTATTLSNLAVLYYSQGRYKEAEPLARRAMEASLRARSMSASQAMTRALFMSEHGASDTDVTACLMLRLQREDDVLALVERVRSLGLRELLAEARARRATDLAKADQDRVEQALGRINSLNRSLEAAAKRGHPTEELIGSLRRAERDYDAILDEIAKQYEQFVALEAAKGITSDQIRRSPALDEQTAIVSWIEFEKMVWGCVVRRSGVHWVDLAGIEGREMESDVRERVLDWARGGTGSAPTADLAALYRLRLQQLESHLKGVKRLIVLAQGWAAVTPVEMLLVEAPGVDQADPSSWQWLGSKYTISYARSCTTLDLLARERSKRSTRTWKRRLIGFGDPPFSDEQLVEMQAGRLPKLAAADRSGATLTRAIRYDRKAVPSRLPGTRLEVQRIAKVMGERQSLLLLGPEASERKLFELSESGDLAGARYVHLATHGYLDGERPGWSGLLLARVPVDADYDGVLHVREVFELKLQADLVVLSACQTGRGKVVRGEGVLGLSTAFSFAGVQSLVVSLWDVPDVSTALLMGRFYENLSKGHDKASALQGAKAWLRNLRRSEIENMVGGDTRLADLQRGFGKAVESSKGGRADDCPYAHPHHWAGFILIGAAR